jgi:MFS family permease
VPAYRRITLAVGLAMFVDATLYLAVLPLLPRYAERFQLGTLGVALILTAYPAPTPVVALSCIRLAPRFGARRIAIASAALMTAATVLFALAPDARTVIAARFLQGVASGTAWTASMAWVTHNAPPDRRGRESGIVMGLLAAGSVVGPGVGALAAWLGYAPAFLLVAGISALTLAAAILAPAGHAVEREVSVLAAVRASARQPLARAALAMALIDPLAFGAIDLLVPLDLSHRGASTLQISAALTIGAALGAVAGPLGGRLVDRIGAPRVGLLGGCLVALTPLPLALGPPVGAELAFLVALSPIFSVAASAMYPLASQGADAARVAHVVVTALLGSCWAIGFTVAPLAAGALADAAGQPAAFVLSSALCVSLLPMVFAATPRGRAARALSRR